MKYQQSTRFQRDYSRLSAVEREKFKATLTVFIAACKHYERHPKAFIWPASLRFERLVGAGDVCAITWSFSGPDGRATFQFNTIEGELWVYWRRVGRHNIYREP